MSLLPKQENDNPIEVVDITDELLEGFEKDAAMEEPSL